jgi:hypothetical protein
MTPKYGGTMEREWGKGLANSRRSIQILYNNLTTYATFIFSLFRKSLFHKRINISHDFETVKAPIT